MTDAPAEALLRLDEITRRLRRECPWDREQDERSIVPHTVEEAYELADAAAAGDDDEAPRRAGRRALPGLLPRAPARGARHRQPVRGRRVDDPEAHPPPSARVREAEAETAGEVLRNWDRIKREEEGRGADDPFADVPENLPALLYARKMQRRAVSAGLTGEEAQERLGDDQTREATERWIGETLFELVDMARRLRVDPELALRAAAQRFRDELSET